MSAGVLDASAEQAAKVIERAYRDSRLRRRAGTAGRENAVELYDIRKVAGDWLALINEAAG